MFKNIKKAMGKVEQAAITRDLIFPPWGWGGGGYSEFQVTGMIEGFFGGLKCSIPGFVLGRKIWQVFFFVGLDLSGDLSMDFFGYSKQSEDSR